MAQYGATADTYYSGWRRGEITGLEWAEVDRSGGVIRLSPERSKNKQGRLLPLTIPLLAVIDRRWQAGVLGCPYVFHVQGRIVGDWRKTWTRACVEAGLFRVVNAGTEHERKLPLKLFHGLRRTAVRDLVWAGVPERVAMSLTGHKTRSVFDRYNITSEADLRTAGVRLAEYLAAQDAKRPTKGDASENPDSSRTRYVVRSATGTYG